MPNRVASPLTLGLIFTIASIAACSPPASTTDSGSDAASDIGSSDDVMDAAVTDVPQQVDVQPDVQAFDIGPVMREHMNYVPAEVHPADGVRLVVMGDSISTGTGSSSRATTSYYADLVSNPDSMFPMETNTDLTSFLHWDGGTFPLVNVAVGGATTSSMRMTQIPALRSALPPPVMGHTIVVITIGGNDLQAAIVSGDPAGQPLTNAIANIRTTVQYLQDPANFPDGTSIYISAVYDPSDGEGFVQGCFFNLHLPTFIPALDSWRTAYVMLGTEMHFGVVDALGHFHGHGHHYDNMMNPYYDAADPTGWFNDCIHPNDRGHSELRRVFYEAIDPTYHVMD